MQLYSARKVFKSESGFTLVELVIVIGIIALITGAVIPSFLNYMTGQNIRQAEEQVKSDLRSAQNKALTGTSSDIGVLYWGVQFINGSSNYYTFASTTTSAPSSCPTTANPSPLPGDWVAYQKTDGITSGNTITLNAGNSSACIYFSSKDGSAFCVKGSPGSVCSTAGGAYYTVSGALTGFSVIKVAGSSATAGIGVSSVGLIKTAN